jgi:Carboxypeptidase regulatory-like domain
MRRCLIAATLLAGAVCLTSPASAAATGTLAGRVVNETTGQPQQGVEVTLFGGAQDDPAGIEQTQTTDARGRYRFEDLETGTDVLYALDARWQGGLFSGPPLSLPDGTTKPPLITSTLRVWDTTDDSSVIAIERDDLFLHHGQGVLSALESVRITNSSDRAYIGRGGTEGSGLALGFALPSDASTEGLRIENEGTSLQISPPLLPTSYGFGITHAIPPGQTNVSFSYVIEGSAGIYDLSRPSLYPIAEMTIHAEEDADTPVPLRLDSLRLEEGNIVPIGDRTYRRWAVTEPLDAGDQLQVQAVAEAGGLAWPVVLVGALLLAGVVISVTKLKSDRPIRAVNREAPRTRQQLVEAIAALDIKYSTGEIDKDEWQRQRSELKEKVGASETR